MDQEALGRQADPEGHPGRRRRAAARPTAAPTRSSSRNHGGRQLDGARVERSARCRRSSTRWARASRCCMDGGIRSRPGRAQGAARSARKGTYDRPRVPLRPRRDGRGRRDQGAARSSTRSSTSRWRSAAAPTSLTWTRACCCQVIDPDVRTLRQVYENRPCELRRAPNHPGPAAVFTARSRIRPETTSNTRSRS